MTGFQVCVDCRDGDHVTCEDRRKELCACYRRQHVDGEPDDDTIAAPDRAGWVPGLG